MPTSTPLTLGELWSELRALTNSQSTELPTNVYAVRVVNSERPDGPRVLEIITLDREILALTESQIAPTENAPNA